MTISSRFVVSAANRLVPYMSKFILRRIFPKETLTKRVVFQFPLRHAVTIDLNSQKFRNRIQVNNFLPFPVELRHIEFAMKLNREELFSQTQYSRKVKLEPGMPEFELPICEMTIQQRDKFRAATPKTFRLVGQADFDVEFAEFTIQFDSETEPLILEMTYQDFKRTQNS